MKVDRDNRIRTKAKKQKKLPATAVKWRKPHFHAMNLMCIIYEITKIYNKH